MLALKASCRGREPTCAADAGSRQCLDKPPNPFQRPPSPCSPPRALALLPALDSGPALSLSALLPLSRTRGACPGRLSRP
eukprot:7996586-Pyramimonas_sp.AAC.1